MRILITGIHGFVGSNLVTALKEQHYIYGLDIVTPFKEGVLKTYNWNEINNIPTIDIVIHLAGISHDTTNEIAPKIYFDINLGLTQKIFDWFSSSGACKFIFFSSVKAVADSVNGNILTEEAIPNPSGPYGESKLLAEQYINLKDHSDKFIYILRPCMIHGPGNKGNINLLYKIQSIGLPWPLGAFENKRSFCSINNVVFIIQQLINNNINSDN